MIGLFKLTFEPQNIGNRRTENQSSRPEDRVLSLHRLSLASLAP